MLDFAPRTGDAAAVGPPGVSVDEVVAQTGFALAVPKTSRRPARRRAGAGADPRGARPGRAARPRWRDLRTPLTELTGVPWPVVQTGMGWVAGPRLVTAVAEAGGLGILASAR